MSGEARYNTFYQLDEKPSDKPDLDNAAKVNADKKNAPGEKAALEQPSEDPKGAAGADTSRAKDNKAAGQTLEPIKEEAEIEEAKDVDADNVEKELKHDCATHVVHKEHGEGRCVPGMHTLEENEDGTGHVTHYDVMFTGEDGPFIVEDCPVEDLEIVQEMSHGHKKKKK